MSWPRLPLVPVPSITSVLTARIRSRPPSAAAASLIICCSGVACVHAVNAAANNASQVVRFIFPLLVQLSTRFHKYGDVFRDAIGVVFQKYDDIFGHRETQVFGHREHKDTEKNTLQVARST